MAVGKGLAVGVAVTEDRYETAVEQGRQLIQGKRHRYADAQQGLVAALMEKGPVFRGTVHEKLIAGFPDLGHHGSDTGHDVHAQAPAVIAPEQGRDAPGIALRTKTQTGVQKIRSFLDGPAAGHEGLPAVGAVGRGHDGRLAGTGRSHEHQDDETKDLFHRSPRRWRRDSALAGLSFRACS